MQLGRDAKLSWRWVTVQAAENTLAKGAGTEAASHFVSSARTGRGTQPGGIGGGVGRYRRPSVKPQKAWRRQHGD